jgi:transcriptional regulator with XRE-family HTH domain
VASLRKKFGQRLREIRLSRRMSQEQFSETIGVSVDFLSLIERGRNAPSFETLDKIARRLRVSVADLFMFDTKPR